MTPAHALAAGLAAGFALPWLVLSYLMKAGFVDGGQGCAWRNAFTRTLASPTIVAASVLLVTAGFHGIARLPHAGAGGAAAGCLFFFALAWLAWIDLEVMLLPDIGTLPLLAAGGLLNSVHGSHAAILSIAGALMGYTVLLAFNRLCRCAGKPAPIGQGDLKLLAAAGAWLGPLGTGSTLLIASLCAAAVNGALTISGKLRSGQEVPFGPYLAFGAAASYFLLFSYYVFN
ncbi:prepilin peptidase [Paludibacterium paludis]|uniref:Prepilin type IV endopeptidase peptidase domain-containing protein n=1 Tax=Paludibacterium paludis TaxID=1225769 RepID=A0A918P5V4_9NEIS|nr:A24 family peptidase [Paludibacterium paludis]GGY20844.1 hypothetical protein GCM10011289_25610 [Paludibacterium paludis]